MNTSIIPSIASFALVATITPDPNNFMVMGSGVNFGLRLATPHLFGIVISFLFMIVVAGIGLMALFDTFPALNLVLTIASTIYMLFLAWKIAPLHLRKPTLFPSVH